MPNTKSAAKRARQNLKRRDRNRRVKSMVRTAIRRFKESLEQGDQDQAREKLTAAIRQLDKAAAKGVVHKNNAARKKSRLTRLFNRTIAS